MSSLMEEPSVVGEAPIQQNNSLPSVPLVPTNDRVDITEPGTDYFGEQLKDKKQGVLRIGFININSLSKHKATAKYDSIRSSLAAGEIDIIGLAETNKCWHLMESENTWKEVSKTWWKDSHSSISYNSRDISDSVYLPGGTITTAINEYSHRIAGSGVDGTLLGRWSWITLRGKQGIKTTFFTLYRPCKSTTSDNTTYSQHIRYLNVCRRNECPQEAILKDAATAIKHLQDQGHQIVLMADMNSKVTDGNIQRWAHTLDLYEYITTEHGDGVETYNNGRHPIEAFL